MTLEAYYKRSAEIHRKAFDEAWMRFMKEIEPWISDEMMGDLRNVLNIARAEAEYVFEEESNSKDKQRGR